MNCRRIVVGRVESSTADESLSTRLVNLARSDMGQGTWVQLEIWRLRTVPDIDPIADLPEVRF